jgi:hypothetical protein
MEAGDAKLLLFLVNSWDQVRSWYFSGKAVKAPFIPLSCLFFLNLESAYERKHGIFLSLE